MTSAYGWFYWVLLSAVFAAPMAIFAKLGSERVDSDFTTLIRMWVIILTLTRFVSVAGEWSNSFALRSQTWLF